MTTKKLKHISFREFCALQESSMLYVPKCGRKFWIKIPDILIDAIDLNLGNEVSIDTKVKKDTRCYIVQGRWGVGKSTLLEILNELLRNYEDYCSNIVIHISDVCKTLSNSNVDAFQTYKPKLVNPLDRADALLYNLIHHSGPIPKFVLIDNCLNTPHDLYIQNNIFPFDMKSWNLNTIYILAGPGSWKLDYGNEIFVHRTFNNVIQIKKYFLLVAVKDLTSGDINDLLKAIDHKVSKLHLKYINCYCDGRFFFINQINTMITESEDNFELADYFASIFDFIHTKFKNLVSNQKEDVWDTLIKTIYYSREINPLLSVFDTFKNTLEMLDPDNSLIPPFEDAFVVYFRTIKTDEISAIASKLSAYLFEASFMPNYLNCIAKSDQTLIMQYESNTERFTKLTLTGVTQLLKSSPEFLEMTGEDTAANFIAKVSHFYLLPPRFPVIDGFFCVDKTCYAVQISNFSYANHKSKKAGLKLKIDSKEFPFLQSTTVEHFLKQLTKIALKNIQYIYISPVYDNNCSSGIYQMPQSWLEAAYKNQRLKQFKEYIFPKIK
eukprot:NODE_65_length_25825_cov_1.353844.p5 type:complete len:551 gc:universal NODE_65_length_25825_cov_1.353844:16257-14605(-)